MPIGRVSVSVFIPSCENFICVRCLPSPLVAQLGSTFQTWSLAILSRSSAWATSLGRMAEGKVISIYNLASVGYELKHTAINILLVGEDEEDNVAHFAILDDTAEFGFGFLHAGPVAGVDYENESVGAYWVVVVSLWFGILDFGWLQRQFDQVTRVELVLPKKGMVYPHTREVVSPKRPNLILSTDIPNIETCVLVRDGLDVEADSRNGVDFACGAGRELEGVKDGFEKVVLASWLIHRLRFHFIENSCNTKHAPCGVTWPLFGL